MKKEKFNPKAETLSETFGLTEERFDEIADKIAEVFYPMITKAELNEPKIYEFIINEFQDRKELCLATALAIKGLEGIRSGDYGKFIVQQIQQLMAGKPN